MDAHAVCALLADGGVDVTPCQIRIEAREDRWAVWLPGGRMAWFPMNPQGAQRLEVERRVLDLLGSRCSFQIPRVLRICGAGGEVRSLVRGECDPWALYRRLQEDRGLARQIGRSLGSILVEQHTRITEDDTKGWLPTRLSWPEAWDLIESRLPKVVNDIELLQEIGRVIEHCRGEEENELDDRVLVHGDLGVHNMATDSATGGLAGVFDYEGAAWADRHYDFRYLVFDHPDEDLLNGALEVYEAQLGIQLDRCRIRTLNAACAIGYLAYRQGIPLEERSCGRTLAEDLAWVRHALAAIR
jgi:aminoglycoside phosphotransferase (APT) family kinase protein